MAIFKKNGKKEFFFQTKEVENDSFLICLKWRSIKKIFKKDSFSILIAKKIMREKIMQKLLWENEVGTIKFQYFLHYLIQIIYRNSVWLFRLIHRKEENKQNDSSLLIPTNSHKIQAKDEKILQSRLLVPKKWEIKKKQNRKARTKPPILLSIHPDSQKITQRRKQKNLPKRFFLDSSI